jgi:protein AFG1
VTDVADAMVLKRLFEGIWAGGGTLVATSNRPPESLYEKGLNRDQFLPFVAELQVKCDVHQLRSTEDRDYRLRNAPGESTQNGSPFFHVLSPTVSKKDRAKCTDVFKISCELDASAVIHEGLLLPICHGRNLKVPFCNVAPSDISDTSKRGAAMISFDELCGDRTAQNCSPAGAVDMLAVAQKFHTLHLTDMPKLALSVNADGATNTNPNHARRFVLLLDAMYEKRNRLVISTFAESIEELFAFGKHKDEDKERDDETVKEMAGRQLFGENMSVTDEGGSSGRLTTMIGGMEWSATGLQNASLALAAGAGKLETAFALERAYSRLKEMQTDEYRNVENLDAGL